MSMQFFGKWTFAQSGNFVQIDPASGTLKVAAQPSDGSEKFNAYGTASAFILQANNGLYVVAGGGAYAASAQRTGALNQFQLVADGASFRILDLGVNGQGTQFFWNNAGGALGQVPTSNPPATTDFTQTIVTPSLASILQNGFTSPQPDLTWVCFSGVDFSPAQNLDFTQAILTDADFSQSRIPQQTAFDSCSGQRVNFSNAHIANTSFGSSQLANANFSNAGADGIDFSNAVLNDAILTGIRMRQSQNLAQAVFQRAHLEGADLSGALNILNTDFTGAFLMGAIFTGSSVTGAMILNGANLTGASLNNPKDSVTIFPKMIQLNPQTNFTGANLQYLDFTSYNLANVIFTHADLTGCKLDNAILTNTEFGYAILDGVTFTGGISLQGANLSNASLMGADLTGAQMGAIGLLFRVASGSSDYTNLLNGLEQANGPAVAAVFANNQHPLQGTVTVTASTFAPPNTRWSVSVTLPAPATYTVLLETVGQSQTLSVYQPTTPAVLTNAFMVNVNLTGANLYGVRASGAQLYATAGNKVNLNRAKLDGLQVNNGNLGGIDLSQASLPGVNFDYAVLTGASFAGAQLSVDANGGQPSFNGSNLQGADFTSATINSTIFANAAISVPSPADPLAFAGVWLFSVSAQDAGIVVPELNAASPDPNAPPTSPQHQFTLDIELLQLLGTPGPVPKGIAVGFANANIQLTASAILTIATESVYWQVNDGGNSYVIFESCNSNFQPALGVAAGNQYTTTATFYLDLSLESLLVSGPVNATLAAAFQSAGYPLTSAATILVQQHPTSWQIVDSPTIYSLWLDLQSSLSGCGFTITVRPAIPNTINLFNDVSIALSQRATITRLSNNAGWVVSNDAENPFNPVKNYIEFQIFPNSANGCDVYGSLIRIIRMVTPTQQQFFNIPCSTTLLTQQQLSNGTICPNSDTVATNVANKIPFAQWMRARFLPSPPFCVPDPNGMFNCPS